MKDIKEFITKRHFNDLSDTFDFDNRFYEAKDDAVINADDIDPDKVRQVTNRGEVISTKKVDKVRPGQDAEENDMIVWAVDPPTPEDEQEWGQMDPRKMNANSRMLAGAMKSKRNFMVLGEAGWAKTDLITKMAHRAGYTVLTVYLDKAEATDLSGIPVPKEDMKNPNMVYQNAALPAWAFWLINHKDDKVLLFFDELNQADPGVLNALMPIVLKHQIGAVICDNIVIGAAGNKSKENSSLTDIEEHKPLMARFPVQIDWETHTDESWAGFFEYAHKEWDNKIGKAIIDKTEELKEYWGSPRDITLSIFTWVKENMSGTIFETPEDLIKLLMKHCVWWEIAPKLKENRAFNDKLAKFCEYMYEYASNGGKEKETERASRRGAKGLDQINEGDKKAMIDALEKGFIYYEGQNYYVTLENVIGDNGHGVFDVELTGITAEVLQKILKQMKADGKTPKYETNADAQRDAKANGWLDPDA